MNTQHIDGVLESVYNDDDIARAYPEPTPDIEDAPNYSKAIMTQFRRAKRASMKNDLRSKKIVNELKKMRKKMNKKTPKKPETKRRQKSVFDFGGN